MRCLQQFRILIGVGFLIGALPGTVRAQGSIAGIVKDTSGAVLPGVTVEASSPVLIEKSRSAVTNGTGQYQIVDLRPGTYVVTFTLTGFNTVKREGVELTGSFTATVSVELKVGALEETITVTGETPIVDVQNATRQRVMSADVIAQIPTGRLYTNLGVLIPGVNQDRNSDVGGAQGAQMAQLSAHGSAPGDQRVMQNGINISPGGTALSVAQPNVAAYQEVTIDTAAVDASVSTGGVRINMIPREGANTFKGSGFLSFANGAMQSSNFTQRLRDLKATSVNSIDRAWDVSPGFGGPIKRDKLWYYVTLRQLGAWNTVGGVFVNTNANNPDAWTYAPDTTRPAVRKNIWVDGQTRLTYQATAKNKFSVTYGLQDEGDNWPFGCHCQQVGPYGGITQGNTFTLEASDAGRYPLQRQVQADWTSPVTNKLLLEVVALERIERGARDDKGLGLLPNMISVTEQGGPIAGLTYRAPASFTNNLMKGFHSRAAVSYVTGAHAFKVGFNLSMSENSTTTYANVPYSYRFNNGVPNQITLLATPYTLNVAFQRDLGLYAQDKWTWNRLTLGYGLRFDYFGNTIPENALGPAPLAPTRNITFPEQTGVAWKDLSPKLSVVYDVFGTGKTAVKVSLNRYLASQGSGGLVNARSAINNAVLNTTRTWHDDNHNFFPDCDLLNPLANKECERDANTAFGGVQPAAAVFDPDLLSGWFHRLYNWEFSSGVQHEVFPRVALDVSYFSRWFGNFQVTDNLAVSASDFTAFNVPAPVDARLPDGGGYTVTGLYDLNTNKFGQPTQNYTTLSDNYGKQIQHWNGVDVSLNARLGGGLLLQGGLSTGRTVTDNCEIIATVPELLITGSTVTPAAYCHQNSGFLTQVKILSAYTFPKIAVLVSGTFQSVPGPQLAANTVFSNAQVVGSLGRNLSAGANSNVTVNTVTPGILFGDRLNQLDLRVGKVLRYGKVRATANVDLYNAFNSDTVLTENSNYATWRLPSSTLPARFVKLSLQLDF